MKVQKQKALFRTCIFNCASERHIKRHCISKNVEVIIAEQETKTTEMFHIWHACVWIMAEFHFLAEFSLKREVDSHYTASSDKPDKLITSRAETLAGFCEPMYFILPQLMWSACRSILFSWFITEYIALQSPCRGSGAPRGAVLTFMHVHVKLTHLIIQNKSKDPGKLPAAKKIALHN